MVAAAAAAVAVEAVEAAEGVVAMGAATVEMGVAVDPVAVLGAQSLLPLLPYPWPWIMSLVNRAVRR